MNKDVTDKVEELTLRPLADAIREKLGDAETTVYNEPHLTKGGKIEYATWLVCRHKQIRTEVIFRILNRDGSDPYGVWQWGKDGRFVFPVPPGEKDNAENAVSPSFINQAADRIVATWAEWLNGPPEFLGW